MYLGARYWPPVSEPNSRHEGQDHESHRCLVAPVAPRKPRPSTWAMGREETPSPTEPSAPPRPPGETGLTAAIREVKIPIGKIKFRS